MSYPFKPKRSLRGSSPKGVSLRLRLKIGGDHERVEQDHDKHIRSLLELEGDHRRSAILFHARAYVHGAIRSALEMSDHDSTAMPWSQSDHVAVMDEVRKIADLYK